MRSGSFRLLQGMNERRLMCVVGLFSGMHLWKKSAFFCSFFFFLNQYISHVFVSSGCLCKHVMYNHVVGQFRSHCGRAVQVTLW